MERGSQAAKSPAPAFERLKTGDPVAFASNACLIVRRPGMACGLCRDACPAGVIAGGQWSIAIEKDGCLGCGLCAAVCPTGALAVEGFAQTAVAAAGDRIVLECRRVADADRDPDAVAVPCLGGLSAPDLLSLAASAKSTIIVADHGWCAACPVGKCGQPWQEAVEEAKSTLATVMARLADRIVVERIGLPVENAMPVLPALRPGKQVGRRDFLQRFVGTAEPQDLLAESRRIVFGRGLVTSIKRERILEQVGAVALAVGRDVSAQLFPTIRIAEGCDLRGLCAAICPTGALRHVQDDGSVSLMFDATGCIACGECQRVCPGKALSLWPEGDGTRPQGARALITRQTAQCAGCGSEFVSKGDGDFCLSCQKSMDVMQEIASLKFATPASR